MHKVCPPNIDPSRLGKSSNCRLYQSETSQLICWTTSVHRLEVNLSIFIARMYIFNLLKLLTKFWNDKLNFENLWLSVQFKLPNVKIIDINKKKLWKLKCINNSCKVQIKMALHNIYGCRLKCNWKSKLSSIMRFN